MANESVLPFVHFDHPMDNGNFSTVDTEDNDVTSANGFFPIVGEKKKIATMKRRLHTATIPFKFSAGDALDDHKNQT
jgi:hypothetical protein